MLSLDCTQCR